MYNSNYTDQNYYTYGESGIFFDKKDAKRRFSTLFLAIAVYIAVSTAVVFAADIGVVLIFGREIAGTLLSDIYYIFALQVLAMYIIAFPIFLLITRKVRKRDYTLSTAPEKKQMSLGEFTATFFVACAFMTFGALVSNLFTEFLSELLGHTVENGTSELIKQTPIWLTVLVAVIIGPIIEELIFRKVFIDSLERYGNAVAILVSSVAFGIFHGNFSQLLYASLLGLIFGHMYTKTKNVLYPILMHMLINFFGTVPSLLLSDSLDRLTGLTEEAINETEIFTFFGDIMNAFGLMILQYGFAVAGVFIFVYSVRNRLFYVDKRCDFRIPRSEITNVIILNAGAVIFLVISLGQFILSIL